MRLHFDAVYNEYAEFLPGLTQEDALLKLKRYEEQGEHDDDVLDLATTMLANAISIVIVISQPCIY
jgi:hypothetical protein